MKRTVIVAGVIALLLTPAILTAQTSDSDSAELKLTGNVPSLVKIGFGNTETQEAELDFGDLSDAQQSDSVTVKYLANVSFSIDVESSNGGVLVNSDASGTGFQDEIGYTLNWDETDTEIAGDPVNLVSGESSGINSTTAQVIVDQASLDNVDQDTTEGDIPAAGEYTDDLTFTITADQ